MTQLQTRVVVFDFDGVFVLDSEAVFKEEAWRVALQRYGDVYKPLLKEAKTLFGYGKKGGRVETLQHVLGGLGIAGENLPRLVSEAAQIFDSYVQEHIRAAGLVSGAKEMLEQLSQSGCRLYLNSGTATAALTLSAQNLGIDHYFAEMLGSTADPVGGSKLENLIYIANKEGVGQQDMLMVGDGLSDKKAADEFGCRFIGVASRHNRWNHEKEISFTYVTDLREILHLLERP